MNGNEQPYRDENSSKESEQQRVSDKKDSEKTDSGKKNPSTMFQFSQRTMFLAMLLCCVCFAFFKWLEMDTTTLLVIMSIAVVCFLTAIGFVYAIVNSITANHSNDSSD